MSNSNYGANWERELQEQGFLDAGRLVQAKEDAKLTFTFGREGHVKEFSSSDWELEIANPFVHIAAKGKGARQRHTFLIDDLIAMSWMGR